MIVENTERELDIDWHKYEPELMSLCQSKAEEFRLLGYEEVTAEDIWACVQHQVNGPMALHALVSAILGLQAGKFMSYLTMNAYRGMLDGAAGEWRRL
ncbi:MAG: post-transcriptional regulator [Alicyclobacillus sp.]|nr:post-transcriptional regulator [Alicyclobacillus sp.]